MRAAVTVQPREMKVVDVEEPQAEPEQAILRVDTVGLCGSDVHFFGGHHPYASYPRVQGHEFSGVVEQLPERYRGELHVGDLVAVEPLVTCGTCFPCRRGSRNCCVRMQTFGVHRGGALAERIAVPVELCFPAPRLDGELAALVEPTSIALQALARSGASAGDRVVVLGGGPIGLCIAIAALDVDAEVLVVERLDSRLRVAADLGMQAVVDPGSEDVASAVARFTDGDGPAVVIEATGVPALVRLAVDLVAPSGTVVVVGLSEHEVSIPVITFTRKELNLLGSRNNSGRFAAAVELADRQRDRLRRLVSHRFDLESAPEAIALLSDSPAEAMKVLVAPARSRGFPGD